MQSDPSSVSGVLPRTDRQSDDDLCDQELARIRAEFNGTAAGGWGIVLDRRSRRWTAVRGVGGGSLIVHAGSADELRERITTGQWTMGAISGGLQHGRYGQLK